jgi:hypothetical protein
MPDLDEDLTGQPWTREEVEVTVADYFQMLRLELLGQAYNKSAHRRALQQKLSGRSEGAIEMKHQNISAVMIDLGAMPLRGYRGLPNYQVALAEVVADRLGRDEALDKAAIAAVSKPAETPLASEFQGFVVERPSRPDRIATEREQFRQSSPVIRDYLEREARNRSLGAAGEALVLRYEAIRLHTMGCPRLADRIEHVSVIRGDGAGFDILSFEPDGKERFIEVKTTSFAETTPFYISRNEVGFAKANGCQYRLYRLFDFRKKPRMYELAGPVEASCRLDPITYRAVLL